MDQEHRLSPSVTIAFAAGERYWIMPDGVCDGYRLTDTSGNAAGFISRAADRCSTIDGSWGASVQRARRGWTITLRDHHTGDTVTHARATSWPHRFALIDAAGVRGRLATRYGGRWEMKVGTEALVRFEIGSRFARLPTPFAQPQDPPDAGLIEVIATPIPAAILGRLLLTALITVRADTQVWSGPGVPLIG